jgi:RNA-directed DNA polymerase
MNARSSITLDSEDLTDKELAKQWKDIPLEKAENFVNRLQKRIAKAVKEGKYRLAKRLQHLLTNSFYAKVLAVRKVWEQYSDFRVKDIKHSH